MAEKRGGDFGASWVASGDLSGHQFRLVTFAGNNCLATTSGAALAGVLQNKPRNAEHASVVGFGYSKLFIGGSMGAGGEFMAGASGVAVAVGSGQFCGGHLLTNGNSGEIVEAYVSIHKKGAY